MHFFNIIIPAAARKANIAAPAAAGIEAIGIRWLIFEMID